MSSPAHSQASSSKQNNDGSDQPSSSTSSGRTLRQRRPKTPPPPEDEDEKPTPLCVIHDDGRIIQANGRNRRLVYLDTDEDKYQAEIDPETNEFSRRTESYRDDQDELMLAPPPEGVDFDVVRNKYWMCIWRQYEGHVGKQRALEHLQKCEWSIQKALETIDDVLRELPEPYGVLKECEVKYYRMLLKDLSAEGRWEPIDNGRRHSPEEFARFNHHFHYRYLKEDKRREETKPPCIHTEPLVQDIEFEPRWACSQCSRVQRPGQPADGKLCLICQTYSSVTDGLKFPATNVYYSGHELDKIAQWKALEDEKGKVVSRQEFQKHLAKKDAAEHKRHLAGQFSTEEMNLLKECYVWKGRSKTFDELEDKELAALLKPHPIPMFRKCKHNEEAASSSMPSTSGLRPAKRARQEAGESSASADSASKSKKRRR